MQLYQYFPILAREKEIQNTYKLALINADHIIIESIFKLLAYVSCTGGMHCLSENSQRKSIKME